MFTPQTADLNLIDQSDGPTLLLADVGSDQSAWLADNNDAIRSLVTEKGALVLRGLDLSDPASVGSAVAALAKRTMTDVEAFAGRQSHPGGVYSSSAWPPNQQMCMHHEMSYRLQFPGLMMFACLTPPTSGGEIGIADAHSVLAGLPRDLAQRFAQQGWTLVRNYTEDIGLSIEEAFGTSDRSAIEDYASNNSIELDWCSDGSLRTSQHRKAVIRHPKTKKQCWFNQIAFLSQWTLNPEVRDFLVDLYGPDGLPFNTTFGNGDTIGEDVVRTINDVYDANTVRIALSAGDLILVDNLQTAHSREPYEGDRKMLVTLAEPVRFARSNAAT